MTWPVEYGGHGRTRARAVRRLRGADRRRRADRRGVVRRPPDGPDRCSQFGTDEQRRRWLPGIVAGTSMWCIGMSEPDAGSDVAVAAHPGRPRRRRRGWSTARRSGPAARAIADWCYLIARTDPDAPKPTRACPSSSSTCTRPGITVRPISDMTDSRHFCEVIFDDVRVPAGQPGRRAQRQLPPAHAPDGARARRHRPARVATARCTDDCLASWADTDRPARAPGGRRASRPCYRIGRLLVLREMLRPGAAGASRPPPRRSAPSSSSGSPTSAARVAGRRGDAAGTEPVSRAASPATSATRPATRSWAAPTQILRNILGERVLGLPR